MFSTRKKLEQAIISTYSDIQVTLQKVELLVQHLRYQQNSFLEQAFTQSGREYLNAEDIIEDYLYTTVTTAEKRVAEALNNIDLAAIKWTPSAWANFNLQPNPTPPSLVRIGELRPELLTAKLPTMPALLPLIGGNHVLVFCDRNQVREATEFISGIVWRIAAFTDPFRYRLALIDTLDQGAHLSNLLKLPEVIRGPKIFCQDEEIRIILQSIVNDIEDTTQHRLQGQQFSQLEDYNNANPQAIHPFRFVVFTAFPHGFSDTNIRLLETIAHNGRRAGVYLLGVILPMLKDNYQNPLEGIAEDSSFLSLTQPGWLEWDDPSLAHIPIEIDPPPIPEILDLIANDVDDKVRQLSELVDFVDLAPELSDWWKSSSADGMVVPIGINTSGKHFNIQIGPSQDAFHILVGGRIGSGKSVFLHTLLLQLCTRYSWEELEVYLLDFKEGVEFQIYANHGLPHGRAVVIEAEREFGVSVLEYLVAEMEKRGELFKKVGVNVRNIEDFRSISGEKLPRILAIIDEFIVLFEEDDALANRAYEALLALATRSRVFGIHLVLAAQRPVAASFHNLNSIKSQINLRVGFKVNEADDSILILGEGNDHAARLERKGIAAITYEPSIRNKVEIVKVAYAKDEDRHLYLQSLSNQTPLPLQSDGRRMLVFSRYAPIALEDVPEVRAILSSTKANHSIEYPSPVLWLGQPIRLGEDERLELLPTEGQNILIVGGDSSLASSIILNSFLGLCLTCAPDKTEFFWIESPRFHLAGGDYLHAISSSTSHKFKTFARNQISIIFDELDLRLENRLSDDSVKRSGFPPLFIFIPGLQRIPELTSSGNELSNENGTYQISSSERLLRLLQVGPSVAIHTLLYVDRLASLKLLTGSYGLDILEHFAHRIALHMQSEDSNDFLGVSDAGRLGQNPPRIIYRNHAAWRAQFFDKVKPYNLPDAVAYASLLTRITQTWS